MKKIIAFVLAFGIIFSMFSAATFSTAAAAAQPQEGTAGSSETVGAPENPDEYAEIRLGETATDTAIVKRRFTPEKAMVLKITVASTCDYLYNTVQSDDDTLQAFASIKGDGYTEYYYGLRAQKTVYLSFSTYHSWGSPSESEKVDISITPEECTDWQELSLSRATEYNYSENTEFYYFYFVAPDDRYTMLNCLSDGATNVWLGSANGDSVSGRNFYSSNNKRTAIFCRLNAGNVYMVKCKYVPGYREQRVPGKIKIWFSDADSISVGETKQHAFDETSCVAAQLFTPEKDMFIKYTPTSVSDGTNTYNNGIQTIIGDSDVSADTKGNGSIISKVYAGNTYLIYGYFDNLGSGNSEVTLEEYTPGKISVNEVVKAQIPNGSKDYFRLVPDKDTDVMVETYYSRVSLKNANLEDLTPLNGTGRLYEFYRLHQGETYYVEAPGASSPREFSINEIVPKEISLNESNPSPGDSYINYYFYTFTPDTSMVASVYFSEHTNYAVAMYTPDWEPINNRKLSRADYTYDLNTLESHKTGTEEYYLLQGGETYLFVLSCSLSDYSDNDTADFKLQKKEFTDLSLNEYQSLYNHVPNEHFFFRFTPDETGFVKGNIAKDEEDTRMTNIRLYDSDFKLLSSSLDQLPKVLNKGTDYYIIANTVFDLYCDDLDCGFSLDSPDFKTVREGETFTLKYGDIARFSPDKPMLIQYGARGYANIELYDNQFTCTQSDISNITNTNQIVGNGQSYYLRNKSKDREAEINIKLIAYPEILQLNDECVVTIQGKQIRQYFLFTPETDMTVEFYGTSESYQNTEYISPIGEVWDKSYDNYSQYNDGESFSVTINATAGQPILLSTLVRYSDSGSYMIGVRNSDSILPNQLREIKESDSNHAEKTFSFTASEDMLIRCDAESYYSNVIGSSVQIADSEHNLLEEKSSEEYDSNTSLIFEVTKGNTYYITVSFDSEDEPYCYGEFMITQIKDLHLGDTLNEDGLYRFIPEKDVYPVLKVTTEDGSVFFDSVKVMNDNLEYLRPRNDFGGEYFVLSQGKTYYIEPTAMLHDWISEEKTVEFCEPETINAGETKSAHIPDSGDWLYQIVCDKETTVKFSGTGKGKVLAVLRDEYGNVLKNSSGGEDVLFSFGYTINAGQNLLLVIYGYEDTDIQVTASVQGDFEIVDDVIVKYYGNQPEPVLPNAKAIGEAAFLYSDKLQTLLVPNTVNEIGANAFARCYALNSATIPGSVKRIGDGAFEFDTALNDISLGEGITEIGNNAFMVCNRLSDIKLPQTLTKIGSQAFLSCTELNEITIPQNVAFIGDRAFGYYDDYNGIAKKPGFTIRGYKGTAAEKYALDNGFTFIDLGGNPEPEIKIGDANKDGSIDISDGTFIQLYIAKAIDESVIDLNAADTTGDGNIDITDATNVQLYIAKVIDHFR